MAPSWFTIRCSPQYTTHEWLLSFHKMDRWHSLLKSVCIHNILGTCQVTEITSIPFLELIVGTDYVSVCQKMYARDTLPTVRVFESGDYHLNDMTTKSASFGLYVEWVSHLVVLSVYNFHTTCGAITGKGHWSLPQKNWKGHYHRQNALTNIFHQQV